MATDAAVEDTGEQLRIAFLTLAAAAAPDMPAWWIGAETRPVTGLEEYPSVDGVLAVALKAYEDALAYGPPFRESDFPKESVAQIQELHRVRVGIKNRNVAREAEAKFDLLVRWQAYYAAEVEHAVRREAAHNDGLPR